MTEGILKIDEDSKDDLLGVFDLPIRNRRKFKPAIGVFIKNKPVKKFKQNTIMKE